MECTGQPYVITVLMNIVFITYLSNITPTVVIITTRGTPAVGETYTLICSVEDVPSSPNIQWFGPNNNLITSGTSMTTLTSTLTLSGLTISDAGEYTCQLILNGVVHKAVKDVLVESEF